MAITAVRAAAFTAALLRIRFNTATVTVINNEGFNNVTNLLTISEAQIDKMVKHIGNWRERCVAPTAGAATVPQVNFTFLVIQTFRGSRYFITGHHSSNVKEMLARALTQMNL
jgi:hypothetical protein